MSQIEGASTREREGDSDPCSTLRIWVCPVCDYSLAGLPDVGLCPECGRGYDSSEIYLYGNALGRRRNAWNNPARGWKGITWAIISMLLFGGIYILPGWHDFLRDPILLICFGFAVMGTAISIWRGTSDPGSGVVQVRLTAKGMRQGTRALAPLFYERNVTGELVPWEKVKEAEVRWRGYYGEIRLANDRKFLRLEAHGDYVHANFSSNQAHFAEVKRRVRRWLAEHGCDAALRYMDEQQTVYTKSRGALERWFSRGVKNEAVRRDEAADNVDRTVSE
jgi:hypothetical protein